MKAHTRQSIGLLLIAVPVEVYTAGCDGAVPFQDRYSGALPSVTVGKLFTNWTMQMGSKLWPKQSMDRSSLS